MNTPLLSPEQRAFFADNGYLHLTSVLSDEAIGLVELPLRKWADRVINRWIKKGLINADYQELSFEKRLNTAWTEAGKPHCNDMMLREIICQDVFSFMQTPSLIGAASELLESDSLLVWKSFHGRAKLPSQETTVDTPWHQDGQYVPSANPFLVTWIPLVDVDEHNSCLRVAAGHQKRGLQENHKFAGACSFHPSVISTLDNIHVLKMKRGDVLFMSRFLPHTAMPNSSDAVRWSFDMRFEALVSGAELPLDRGFICAHEDLLKIETSYEKCYERLWADTDSWR